MHKKLHILLLGLLLSFAVGASEITAGLKGYRLAVAIASMTTDASNVILNNTNQQVLKETIGEDFVGYWQTITAIGDAALLGSMTVTAFRNNSTQSAKALALWNQNKDKLEGKNPILAQKVEKIIENEDMLRGGARAVEGADEIALLLQKGIKNLSHEELLKITQEATTSIINKSIITNTLDASTANQQFVGKQIERMGAKFDFSKVNLPHANIPGIGVNDFKLLEKKLFVKVYAKASNSNPYGEWLISLEDFKQYKSVEVLKDKLALPDWYTPTHFSIAEIPQNQILRESVAAKIITTEGKLWGNGGGRQYEILQFDRDNPIQQAWFTEVGEINDVIK